MILNATNLSYFFTSLDIRFGQAWSATPVWHDKCVDNYPTATTTHEFGWTQMLSKMRLWAGARRTTNIAPATYSVTVQPYEFTLEIDKLKLQDDHADIYYRYVADMALQARKWKDYQTRDLIFNQGAQTGTKQIGTDGVTNWNTAHPVNLYDTSYGTYSNDYRGTYGGLGGALNNNSFANVWEDMAGRVSENGEPFGLVPDMLLFPPQLNYTALTLLQSNFIAPSTLGNLTSQVGSAENQLKNFGVSGQMIADFAKFSTTWFMLDTQRGVKPFSFVTRTEPIMTYRVSPEDPVVFDQHIFLYGLEARGNPAWGPPWLSSISSP